MLSETAIRGLMKSLGDIDERFSFYPTSNDRMCINTLIKNKKKEIAEFEAKIAKYNKFKTDYEEMKKECDINLNDLLTKVLAGNTEDLQWDNVYYSNNNAMYSKNSNPEIVLAAKLADTLRIRLRKNREFALKDADMASFNKDEYPDDTLAKLKRELDALETVKQMLM